MYSVRETASRFGWLAVVGATCAACARIVTGPQDGGDADGDSDADLDIVPPGDADPDSQDGPDARDVDVDTIGADEQYEICDHAVCDLWPPCGCPEGQTCDHADSGERSCVDAGAVGHGGACREEEHDCATGTVCAGFGEEPAYCLQLCLSDEECAGEGETSICEIQMVDDSERLVAMACSLDCDPASITPDCAEGVHCVIFIRDGSSELFTHCIGLAGGGGAGAPCDTANGAADCLPGHFCADGGCIRRCTLPDGVECEGAELCRAFADPAIIGDTEYGYCL